MSLRGLNGSDAHIGWKFVLSKDDMYDDGDAVFNAGMISDDEMAELQVNSLSILNMVGSGKGPPIKFNYSEKFNRTFFKSRNPVCSFQNFNFERILLH